MVGVTSRNAQVKPHRRLVPILMTVLVSCTDKPAASVPPTPATSVTINAIGRLEPTGSIRTVSAAAGIDGARIGKLFVEEGDSVATGQPLFTLDNLPRLQASLHQARKSEELSAGKIDQALASSKPADLNAQRAVIDRLEGECKLAETQWKRAEGLAAKGDVSLREVEQRRAAFDNFSKEIVRARAQLEALATVRPEDVEVARREHELNRAATRRILADIEAATISAPMDGVILRIYNRPGEAATTKVLDLGQTDRMVAMAEVFEADIRRIRPGQQAEILLPALGERLNGHVRRIGHFVGKRETLTADPVAEVEARVFRVHIDLDPASSQLARRFSNMQIEIRILP
jgi:HlyD family secretion protein